jgi:hypothetical protein
MSLNHKGRKRHIFLENFLAMLSKNKNQHVCHRVLLCFEVLAACANFFGGQRYSVRSFVPYPRAKTPSPQSLIRFSLAPFAPLREKSFLRALRVLRGEISIVFLAAAPPRWVLCG